MFGTEWPDAFSFQQGKYGFAREKLLFKVRLRLVLRSTVRHEMLREGLGFRILLIFVSIFHLVSTNFWSVSVNFVPVLRMDPSDFCAHIPLL